MVAPMLASIIGILSLIVPVKRSILKRAKNSFIYLFPQKII
jgi:hypothetical protein